MGVAKTERSGAFNYRKAGPDPWLNKPVVCGQCLLACQDRAEIVPNSDAFDTTTTRRRARPGMDSVASCPIVDDLASCRREASAPKARALGLVMPGCGGNAFMQGGAVRVPCAGRRREGASFAASPFGSTGRG